MKGLQQSHNCKVAFQPLIQWRMNSSQNSVISPQKTNHIQANTEEIINKIKWDRVA